MADDLRRLPRDARSLDVDATGRHLLLTEDDGRVVTVGPSGEEEVLASGLELAVW